MKRYFPLFLRSALATVLLLCVTTVVCFSEDSSASRRTKALDPKMNIFLAFGQSNMEGNARLRDDDQLGVDPRFMMMAAVDDPSRGLKRGDWTVALPPLCRPGNGLTPLDWFGRTMVKYLPEDEKVGVVNVAIGGCKIEAFMRGEIPHYVSEVAPDWMKPALKAYDNDPYGTLLALAKEAQKKGVIRGILMHQGESNINEEDWPLKVKSVYEDLLSDLGLNAEEVPLLVGEVVNSDRGGVSASMNDIIDRIPETIPTAHVISSSGCRENFDRLHFSHEGYEELGRRYALEMLKFLKVPVPTGRLWYSDNAVESPIIHPIPSFPGRPRPSWLPEDPVPYATFNVRAPGAKEVLFSSQFTEGNLPMKKNKEGIWSITLQPSAADIYPYNFIIDGVSVSDPLNTDLFPNENFKASLVQFPSDKAPYTMRDVPHGRVTMQRYYSDVLGMWRPVLVYTPPTYQESGSKTYPVFFLVSGTTDTEETWLKVGKLDIILDNLIAEGKAEEMVVVMPYGNMMGGTPMPSTLAAADMYKVFANEVMTCTLPFIEKNYRVRTDRDGRAMAGFSRGGGQSLFTVLSNLDSFSYLCSYSAYLTPEMMQVYFSHLDAATLGQKLHLLWYGVGKGDFLYEDVLRNEEYLDSKGITYEKMFTDGGHTWMNARTYLRETLQKLFRTQ